MRDEGAEPDAGFRDPAPPGAETPPPDGPPDARDDVALWRDLRAGDRDAFRALFVRHSDAVYNFGFRRTGSWAVADDVVQATFTALWRRVQDGGVDDLQLPSARPVLFSMARNECSNQLRSVRRQTGLVDRIEAQPERSGTDDTDRWVTAEATMREISRALRVLPRNQREVVELVAWSELSLAEAGAVLGLPVGTVKSRLKRARDRLHRTPLANLLYGSPE